MVEHLGVGTSGLAKLKEDEKISYICMLSHFIVAEFALHLQLKGEISVAVQS